MTIERAFMNILCDDPVRSSEFYLQLFEMRVAFESAWFMHLVAEGNDSLELGLLRREHELVHPSARGQAAGAMLSLVVEDVDRVHARAQAIEGVDIVEAPRDLFYGQRRMLLRDPDGALVDVSSACAPDPAWMQRVQAREGGGHVESGS